MEDINSACVYERGFFLELCSNFCFLIFIEFIVVIGYLLYVFSSLGDVGGGWENSLLRFAQSFVLELLNCCLASAASLCLSLTNNLLKPFKDDGLF